MTHEVRLKERNANTGETAFKKAFLRAAAEHKSEAKNGRRILTGSDVGIFHHPAKKNSEVPVLFLAWGQALPSKWSVTEELFVH